MTPWAIHPAALAEHDEIIRHFAGIDHRLAVAFEDVYRQCRSLICTNPLQYNLRNNGVRRVNLTPQFGEYYLAYTLWNDHVVILAVAHAKRRPGYWLNRVTDASSIV